MYHHVKKLMYTVRVDDRHRAGGRTAPLRWPAAW